MEMPKSGGTPSTFIGGVANPNSIVVDSINAYWGSGGTLAREALVGSPITYIDFNGVVALAQDAANIYWISNLISGPEQASKSGGPTVVLAAGLSGPNAIAVDSTSVYWTDASAGTVSSIPIGGGTIKTLVSGQNPDAVAVDAVNVYWVNGYATGNSGTFTVCSMPIGGGTVTTLATGQQGASLALALDGTTLYWTNYAFPGDVMKMPASGGAVTIIATGQNLPAQVVVDDTSVYWTNSGSGQVMRTPK